jgi:hypothetical protein
MIYHYIFATRFKIIVPTQMKYYFTFISILKIERGHNKGKRDKKLALFGFPSNYSSYFRPGIWRKGEKEKSKKTT